MRLCLDISVCESSDICVCVWYVWMYVYACGVCVACGTSGCMCMRVECLDVCVCVRYVWVYVYACGMSGCMCMRICVWYVCMYVCMYVCLYIHNRVCYVCMYE